MLQPDTGWVGSCQESLFQHQDSASTRMHDWNRRLDIVPRPVTAWSIVWFGVWFLYGSRKGWGAGEGMVGVACLPLLTS